MTANRCPGPGESAPSALSFEPVRLRYRRDGWTPARQRRFIATLRARRCVLEACRRVGLSAASAYKLYDRPDAASFRRAWDAALAWREPVREAGGATHWISKTSFTSSTSTPVPAKGRRRAQAMKREGGFAPRPVL